MLTLRPLLRLAFAACLPLTLALALDTRAQTPASASTRPPAPSAPAATTGAIEGRVQNAATGDFLTNARITVKGSNLVTYSDEGGFFRLAGIPAGPVVIRAFFTSLSEKEIPLAIVPGGTVTQDIALTHRARSDDPAATETVKLDAFKVQSTRETDAAAIAVNEQRAALGQKSVVSADQFGTIPDSNPGELMKWLPGVSVEYFANNIVGVSVRGLDAVNTEIRFDGMPVASASTSTLGTSSRDRNFEMLGSSSADIARVEVRKLRTPQDSANALGGSVNLVRRSAFEASKRSLTYAALFTTDAESFSLGPRPGIRDTLIRGWRPNFKLTWTDPVSKTFGYALTLNHNDVLARVHWSFPGVNFGNANQAVAAKARVAAGLPLTTASVLNPQFSSEGIHDNPKQDVSDGASAKFDWRPTRELKLSYSLTGGRYQERAGDDIRFNWNTGNQSTAVTDAVLNTRLGLPGTNDAHNVYGGLGTGTIRYDLREAWRNGQKDTLTNLLEAEWRRGDWTLSSRGSFSTSKHTFGDIENGFFGSSTMSGSGLLLTGVGTGTANPIPITVNYLDRNFTNSKTIKAYTVTPGSTTVGPELDWQNLNNMKIGGAVSRPGQTNESIAALRLWAKRSFSLAGNPFAVRLGYDYDEQFRNVQTYDAKIWTFVGPNGVAGGPGTEAAQIAAVNVPPARDSYYDFPAVPRISMRRLYDLYVAHPTWFAYRDAESHRFSVTEPYEVNEQTTAPWLELTGAFFRNRLTYVGGLRYEKAEATGVGSLDRGARYVTSRGLVDQSLAGNLLRYVRKGARGKGSNDGLFPSLQLNYSFTDAIVLRAGYAATQAKNRFGRAIIPSSSFDYNPVLTGTYSGVALGSVNRPNPNLKPWTADNYEAAIQYYTPQGGVFSVGGFVKEIDRVQIQRTILLDTPARLAELDLEPTFLNFQSTTWVNDGKGQITGVEFEARQPLDVWLPRFARGFTFTGSYNYNNLAKFNYANGNLSGDFQNFYEDQEKASLSFRRGKFSGTVGLIRNGRVYRQREDVAATATAPAVQGHRFYPAYTTVDFSLEYGVTKWAKLFLSGRNVTNAQKTRYRVVDGAPTWSYFQIANNLGATFTAGLSGTF
jgi:iron complex outermembrane receptor protein